MDPATETRTTHYYRTPEGSLIRGYGPSMEPHRCGHPDEPCWTVTETRDVTPWTQLDLPHADKETT